MTRGNPIKPRVVLEKSSGKWGWRLFGINGLCIAKSQQNFSNHSNAKHNLRTVRKALVDAHF